MDASVILTYIGLGGAGACFAAYAWGYVLKPAGFRWLHVLSLFSTIIALAELTFALRDGSPPGGSLNGIYAMVFLLVSGFAQSMIAVQARAAAGPAAPAQADAAPS